MTTPIDRMRVDAPKRYRAEVEEARRLAERRGFETEVDEFGEDVRLTVRGDGDPERYLEFAGELFLPVFSLDVHVGAEADPLHDTAELDRAFDEMGLYVEFWAA